MPEAKRSGNTTTLSLKSVLGVAETLLDAWRLFVIQSLTILKDKSTKEKIPQTQRLAVRAQSDGALVEDVIVVPVFQDLVENNKTQLTRTPEYGRLSALMESDSKLARHIGPLIMTFQGGRSLTLWDWAKFPLIKQLEKKGDTFSFDERIFGEKLSGLLEFFSKDTVEFLYVAPLQNFDSNVEQIELAPKLRIRRITLDELAWCLQFVMMIGSMPFFKVFQFKFVIEATIESPKRIGSPIPIQLPKDPSSTVSRIITALRLLKSGNVSYSLVKVTPVFENPGVGESGQSNEPLAPWGNRYLADKSEVDQLKEIWKSVEGRDIDKPSAVNIALRRFGFSYDRIQQEDKLIDLMIAFEALLLEGPTSAAHKLALRFAKLMGSSFAQRKDLYKEMKRFYDVRSRLVHGTATPIDERLVMNVEQNLRQCIVAVLTRMNGQTHETLLAHLDLD
jgi:hypothetical protein